MEAKLKYRLDAFNRNIVTSGEDIFYRVFPAKILELQDLIESTTNPDSPFHAPHVLFSTDPTVYFHPNSPSTEESREKKRKLTNGTDELHTGDKNVHIKSNKPSCILPGRIQANQHMSKIHNIVKSQCESMITSVDQMKLWVTLTIPKIEDGDNVGVQIQEEVLAELHRAQESAYNLRDTSRQDYLARAKICSKLLKYPNIEDYTLALREHDERQVFLARQHLFDIRNMYVVLTDLMHKNIIKV